MFYDNLMGLVRVAAMAVLAYSGLIVLLRIAGKRALAKLNAFDLVVTVALGSTLATILLSRDVALAEGVLALAMLAALQWVVSRSSIASHAFARLIRSQPRLLLEHGKMRKDVLRKERVTVSEVLAAVRSSGMASVENVAAVVLESDGSLSVIAGSDGEPTALADVAR